MEEMRGGQQWVLHSASRLFELFFGKLLVPVVISDSGSANGGRGSDLQLLPSGAAVSGIVPFTLAVVAYECLFELLWYDMMSSISVGFLSDVHGDCP
jgi:hypothetical protein